MRGDPVVLVPYDPAWPRQAAAESAAILVACQGLLLSVDHIGSTSVPGLAAKPVIDLLGGVARLEDANAAIPPLATLGYSYVPKYESELPDRRYFRRGPDGARTHHLHVFVRRGASWARHVAFRDALRALPTAALDYERLKRELAASCGPDRDAYTRGKSELIRETIERWEASRRASRSAPSSGRLEGTGSNEIEP